MLEYSCLLTAGMYGMLPSRTPLAEGKRITAHLLHRLPPCRRTFSFEHSTVGCGYSSHIDWAGCLQKWTVVSTLFLFHWSCREIFLDASCLIVFRAADFMNVDQFIIVYYLKKEVWGFESYSLSGTTCFLWNYLSGH